VSPLVVQLDGSVVGSLRGLSWQAPGDAVVIARSSAMVGFAFHFPQR
jgi:hypothetical protein